jgi:hypothetical protein
MNFVFRSVSRGLAILFFLLSAGKAVEAEEWSFTPLASAELFYNDNYQLSSSPHRTEWGLMLLPEGSFSMENDRFRVTGKGHWSLSRFFDDSALDTDEHDLMLTTSTELTENSRANFSEVNQMDSTLESELRQTGLLVSFAERHLNTISAGFGNRINEKLSLNLDYSNTQVAYAGNHIGLDDYRVHSVTASLKKLWNERADLFLNGHYSYSQMEGILTVARDTGFTGGGNYQFSEMIRGTFSAGMHWSDNDISFSNEAFHNRASGATLDAQLERDLESGHAVLDLTRDTQISGSGTIQEVDRASVGFDQNLSERVSLSVNGAISLSQPFADARFSPQSEYQRYEGKLVWQASHEISVTLEYSYTKAGTEGLPDTAVSNSAYLMATWQFLKRSISR